MSGPHVAPQQPCPAPFPGLTQYSGDPHTEWDLNAFGTKEEVLAAVHSLHYRGGNTFTGTPHPRAPRVPAGRGLLRPLS